MSTEEPVAPQVKAAARRVVPSPPTVALTPLGQTRVRRRSCPSRATGSAQSRIWFQSIPSRFGSILSRCPIKPTRCRSVRTRRALWLNPPPRRLNRLAPPPPMPAISGRGTLRRCRRSQSRQICRRRSRCSGPRQLRHTSPRRAGGRPLRHRRARSPSGMPMPAPRSPVGAACAYRRWVCCCSPQWLRAR
jgi:hypothetical protein